MTSYIFLIIFRCTPIQQSWAPPEPGFVPNCIPFDRLALSGAVITIAFDVFILLLPLRQLLMLKVRGTKQIQLFFLFNLGTL